MIRAQEVYETQNHFIVVMDYVEGNHLFERMVKRHRYSEMEACALMFNLLVALEYLHSREIIHRDIKLDNILMVSQHSDTEIKIGDFGFACYFKDIPSSNKCGTPGYVAPEILNGSKYDEKADMFSTGIVLYIL
jgi:serine/threonine protein kinase